MVRERRALLAIVAAFVVALAPAAMAASFSYIVAGNLLFRNTDGKVLSVAQVGSHGPGPWKQIYALDKPNEVIGGLSCDRASPTVCFVEVIQGLDRVAWRPIDPVKGGATAWSSIEDFSGRITDIDDRSGLALVLAGRQLGAGGLAQGLYLWKKGENFYDARRLSSLGVQCLSAALFVRTAKPPHVFISRGCGPNNEPAAWLVVDADGQTLGSVRPVGLPLAVDGGDLIFSGRLDAGAHDQTVYRFAMPATASAKSVGGPVYQPDPSGDQPAIAHTGPSPFPSTTVAVAADRMVAVARGADGYQLFEFCSVKGDAQSPILGPALPYPAHAIAQLEVASLGGANAIASAWDVWAERRQFLLTPGDHRGCGALTATPLPNADTPPPPRPALDAERRTVVAEDGEAIPYAVIARPESRGPLLAEVYGASDQARHDMLTTPLQRAWVERGGRVVIATVRGDAKDPPWRSNPQQVYQTRAAQDLNIVVADMVRRGDATAGEVTVMGASAGAFTAARAVLMRPDLYNAAVLASGPLDLSLNAPVFGPTTGDFPQWYAGSRKSDGACSAVRFFLYAGANDGRVASDNSTAFAKYVVSLGYHGVLFVVPGAGHYLLESQASVPKVLADIDAWTKEKASCGAHGRARR